MKVQSVSMIYLDDQNEGVTQEDFRIIVRKCISSDNVMMEFNNHSTLDPSTEEEDWFSFRCSQEEAKEIAAALLAAAANQPTSRRLAGRSTEAGGTSLRDAAQATAVASREDMGVHDDAIDIRSGH